MTGSAELNGWVAKHDARTLSRPNTGEKILGRRKFRRYDVFDFVTASVACTLVVLVFIAQKPDILHWFILPVTGCGILVGIDAIRWLRDGSDIFDPKGLIGIFGFNFFFLAPLFVIYFNVDFNITFAPPDWKPWVGRMALLNMCNLIIYQLVQHIVFRKFFSPTKTYWQMDKKRSSQVLVVAAIVCFSAWILVLIRMGGFQGMINFRVYGEGDISGMGLLRIPMRSTMILILMWLTVLQSSKKKSHLATVGLILIIIFIGQFMIDGLSGRRSSVAYPIFWSFSIIHYFWRKFRVKSMVMLVLLPLMCFYISYELYKHQGEAFLKALHGKGTIEKLWSNKRNRIVVSLIGDWSRADIQAWMLYKYDSFLKDYTFRKGYTYIVAPFNLAPRWLFTWKEPYSPKVRAGTEYLFGKGHYNPADKYSISHKVYGLAGEAILNFGIWAIPFAFASWAFVVGFLRAKWCSWKTGDARLLLWGFVCILSMLSLLNDQENVWNSIIIHFMIPAGLVWFCSIRKKPISHKALI